MKPIVGDVWEKMADASYKDVLERAIERGCDTASIDTHHGCNRSSRHGNTNLHAADTGICSTCNQPFFPIIISPPIAAELMGLYTTHTTDPETKGCSSKLEEVGVKRALEGRALQR